METGRRMADAWQTYHKARKSNRDCNRRSVSPIVLIELK